MMESPWGLGLGLGLGLLATKIDWKNMQELPEGQKLFLGRLLKGFLNLGRLVMGSTWGFSVFSGISISYSR